jgi:hypothetical protein
MIRLTEITWRRDSGLVLARSVRAARTFTSTDPDRGETHCCPLTDIRRRPSPVGGSAAIHR